VKTELLLQVHMQPRTPIITTTNPQQQYHQTLKFQPQPPTPPPLPPPLQAHMQRTPLPIVDYATDTRSVMEQAVGAAMAASCNGGV